MVSNGEVIVRADCDPVNNVRPKGAEWHEAI